MPKVYNKRDNHIPPDAVYVGRPTKWGNPYEIGTFYAGKVLTREDCVELYRVRIINILQYTDNHYLDELRGKDLVCWCKPARCHADILLELANR